MGTDSADLVVRVAANIQSLQTDMAGAAASLKQIESAAKDTSVAANGLTTWLDSMGASFVARVTEGVLLRDVIREVISLGKEAFTDAARFEDLARATGLSTDALQRFAYVGVEFGVTTEEIGRAVEQLSARLANGDPNAVKAVQMLGLSVADLLAAGPEEAFLQLAEATGRVEDPMMKAALASDEFGGKLSKVLLPMLGELRQKLAEVPAKAIISDENIKSAHDFDVGLQHLTITLKAYTIAALEYIQNKDHQHAKAVVAAADIALESDALDAFVGPLQRVYTNADLLQNRLEALRAEAIIPLTEAQQADVIELEAYGIAHKEIAQLVGTSESAIHQFDEARKASALAAKQAERDLAKEAAEANAILMLGYTNRIKVLQDLEHASRAAYGFEGQIANLQALDAAEFSLSKRVQDSLTSEKDRAKVREETIKRHIELVNEEMAIELRQLQVTNAAVLAEFQAQVTLNAEWGLNAVGSLKSQEDALYRLNQALTLLHATKVEGISQVNQEQVLMDRYRDATLADATAQDKLNASIGAVVPPLAAASAQADKTTSSFRLLGGVAIDAAASVSLFYTAFGAMQKSMLSNIGTPTILSPYAPSRDAGGPVSANQPYLIGRGAQPELFVPSSAGTMVPNSGAGGGEAPRVIQLVIDGRVLAQVVDDATMARQRNSGQRQPLN